MTQINELKVVQSKHFQFDQKKYLPLRDSDLTHLNANEIKLIDDILDKLSSMNAITISKICMQLNSRGATSGIRLTNLLAKWGRCES